MVRRGIVSVVLALTMAGAAIAPAGAAPTAEELVLALASNGLPIGERVAWTADTDPNHLLGRPGFYDSKASWHDLRLPVLGQWDGKVDDGGSLEVFSDLQAAVWRADALRYNGLVEPSLAEYDMLVCNAVLRLSRRLTPPQAWQYAVALNPACR
jgi:hypothetical protein